MTPRSVSRGSSVQPAISGQQISGIDSNAADFFSVFKQLHEEMRDYLEGVPSAESIHKRGLEELRLSESGGQVADEGSASAPDAQGVSGQGVAKDGDPDYPAAGDADEKRERTRRIGRGMSRLVLRRFSGKSGDYFRKHPDEEREVSARMFFDPSLPKLTADPKELLMRALAKGFITLPEELAAEMRKHNLLGDLTWNAIVGMFRNAFPERFPKELHVAQTHRCFFMDRPGLDLWYGKRLECAALALLTELLGRTAESAAQASPAAGGTLPGAAQTQIQARSQTPNPPQQEQAGPAKTVVESSEKTRRMSLKEISDALPGDSRTLKNRLGSALHRLGSQWWRVEYAKVPDESDVAELRRYLADHPDRPKRQTRAK